MEKSAQFHTDFLCRCLSGRTDVLSLGLSGLTILTELVADILAIAQRSALDRRDMHKDVRAAIVRRNEAETLVLIEKLYSAIRHELLPMVWFLTG